MMSLIRETPEAKSWIYDELLRGGVRLPTVEGFSVKGNSVTALFERLKSTVDIEEWTEKEISSWLLKRDQKDDWVDRAVLASLLDVPLYLVLWQDNRDKYRMLSVHVEDEERIVSEDEKLFNSCKELAKWLSVLKGIQVKKGFFTPKRLSSIDDCLRQNRVPWPGNLDGFLVSPETGRVDVLFELRRTRVYSVEEHNLNKYFHQDFHGWEALDILREQLDVPLYILTWSSKETIVKIHELKKITDSGLKYERTEFVHQNEILPWFRQL